MNAKTKLVTDRIRLRCMEDRDQATLFGLLFNDPDVMTYYSGLKDKRQTREWSIGTNEMKKGTALVCGSPKISGQGSFWGNAASFPSRSKIKP